MNLVWFLRTFVGASVAAVTPRELLDHRFRKADVVFVGLPTRVGPRHLARVSFRQLALFDYHDAPEVFAEYTDLEFLSGLTRTYFKACVESSWTRRWHWGCLPLRRYGKLTREILLTKTLRAVGRRAPPRVCDVGFLGYPTALIKVDADGQQTQLHQRVEWMSELVCCELSKRDPSMSFWGGLVLTAEQRSLLQERMDVLAPVTHSYRRIRFSKYFDQLRRCRTLLAPAGNARWTYRHYEAVYAAATLVSTDLTNTRLLVPLCEDNILMVPDGAGLMPPLRRALAIDDDQRAEAAATSLRHLEKFYRNGAFHRSKALPFERFLDQIQGDTSAVPHHHRTDALGAA
jgi:hypothetical protein